MRRMLFPLPLFRAIVPRVSRPILPLFTSHISSTSENTRTLTGALRISPFRAFRATPARLSSSSPSSGDPPSSPSSSSPPDAKGPGSLSQRLKTLMKAYGWYAVGVYVAVSAVDLIFAFVGIKLLGADYVSSVVASAKGWVLGLVYSRPAEPGREEMEDATRNAAAAAAGGGQEGLYAMLVLAYIVHKAFLPIRIAFTAAFTPRLVRWLRTKGWAGGAGTQRAIQEMRERLRD